jgi:predicted RNA-binding protein with PUA-like domain
MDAKTRKTTIDLWLLDHNYKRYTSIDDLYAIYDEYLHLPDEDPDDPENDYYDPNKPAQRIWYFAQKFNECASSTAMSTEEVTIGESKYTIEKLNNIIVRVNGVYYYNVALLNSWLRGEQTETTLDKYFG